MIPADLLPDQGARVLAAHAQGEEMPITVWCQHGVTQIPGADITSVVYRFEASDPCRVNELREVFHPARLAERSPSTRPDLAEGVSAFLMTNPPESCGCDPDLAIQVAYPGPSKVLVINLEHEPSCPAAGKSSRGGGFLPQGGASGSD